MQPKSARRPSVGARLRSPSGHRTAAEFVADGQVETILAFIRDLENGARGVRINHVGPDEIFHSYLTPKWAFPARQRCGRGDRFNRPGVEALYLSRAPQTALDE